MYFTFCWRHFIFRYWYAPVSFICFVCFVIIQKFDKTFTLGIPECFWLHIADYLYAFRILVSLCFFFVSFVVTVDVFLCFWMLVLEWYIFKCLCLFSICFVIVRSTAESLNAVVFQTCVRVSWWCSFTSVIVTAMAFKFHSCFESFCGDCFL